MARNPIQMQKGVSLTELYKRFGTEEKVSARRGPPCEHLWS